MYIWERRGLGEYTFSEPKPAPPVLRSKPPYLRYLSLDGFEWNKHTLTDRLRNLVGYFAKAVQSTWNSAEPIKVIRLVGHTDNTGPEDYNRGLGDRRALAVKIELERQLKPLLGRLRIEVEPSPGKTKPAADNRTPKGRAANRRVEVFIITGAAPSVTAPPPQPTPIDLRKAAEEAARRVEEEAEKRRQEQRYNQPVPPPPPGKSISAWLDERLARLPQWLRSRIRDAILKGACALLENLLGQVVGQLSDKEKDDLRKICLEQAKRPIR